MGAPESGMQATDGAPAESLLTAFRTIKTEERAKHAAVLDYWLSIRGDKDFPPLHDLDPLQISDAGSSSILLELIGGGQDAEVRHIGDELKQHVAVERIIDAPSPSLLSSLASKLPIVAISRDFLSFEDSFDHDGGWTRLWVTLLPLSSCGSWVDYVYAFVTVETNRGKAAKEAPPPAKAAESVEDAPADEPAAAAEQPSNSAEPGPSLADEGAADAILEALPEPEPVAEIEPEPEPAVEPEPEPQPVGEIESEPEFEREFEQEPVAELESVRPSEVEPVSDDPPEETEPAGKGSPGFSKLLDGIAQLTGFYGQGVKVDPDIVDSPAEEPPGAKEAAAAEAAAEQHPLDAPEPRNLHAPEAAPDPKPAMEGSLQSKLTEVRAKAEEAVQARLRAVAALHEGLSEAYDFALDAETSPEEYLRLVEAEGLKIQLRAPMAPVARLAFGDSCDPDTIGHCETVLAWALKQELPRGALLERINQAGGIAELAAAVSSAS